MRAVLTICMLLEGVAARAQIPTRPADAPGAPQWTAVHRAGTNAPADKSGDFLIGPEYRSPPELAIVDGVPRGEVRQFTMESTDSKYYPGVAREVFGTVDPGNPKTLIVETHARPWQRAITVYIPAQLKRGNRAAFIVVHDGPKMGEPDVTLPRVLDNLIAQKRVPAMVAVMIQNGGGDAQGSERGLEYDTLSGKLAEFIEAEVLPRVEANYGVKLTRNPDLRAVM
ncbi:MAG TPA: alpha/beta hydrolase-fold protein, partial [Steroidobacteraceae bacterium]|nr:alpha/beta hydrolase-fold protein [Steroidobacteraceae bacterium]